LRGRVTTSVLTGVKEWVNSGGGGCVLTLLVLLIGALVPAVLNGVQGCLLAGGGLLGLVGTGLRGVLGGVVTLAVGLLAVGVLAVGSGVVGLGVVGLLAVHVLPVGLLTAGPVGLTVSRGVISLLTTRAVGHRLTVGVLPVGGRIVGLLRTAPVSLLAIRVLAVGLLRTAPVGHRLTVGVLPVSLLLAVRVLAEALLLAVHVLAVSGEGLLGAGRGRETLRVVLAGLGSRARHQVR